MSKTHEILMLVFMVGSFGLGYGYRNSQSVETTKTVDSEVNHTVTTTVTTKTPDGAVKTVKTSDSNTKSKSVENKQLEAPKQPAKGLNISAMAGYDLTHIKAPVPVYGVSISRQVDLPLIGGVTGGIFGMTNGLVGISLGKSF